jgi:hypothetical protein
MWRRKTGKGGIAHRTFVKSRSTYIPRLFLCRAGVKRNRFSNSKTVQQISRYMKRCFKSGFSNVRSNRGENPLRNEGCLGVQALNRPRD